jgi:hypothetical protein
MDRRCGGCRFWGKPAEAGFEFRVCTAVEHDDRYLADQGQDCDWAEDDEERAEKRSYRDAHEAVVEDGSGFHAALRTRDDFGCVLFEPKG